MITFVTDIRLGEVDILSQAQHNVLLIKNLNGDAITSITPPQTGWSHRSLTEVAEDLPPETERGADAYLGNVWVGSTEV